MGPVAVTVLADWTENLLQLGQLRRYTEDGEAGLQPGWIRIASAATNLKMLSVRRSVAVSRGTCHKRDSSCAQTGIVEPPPNKAFYRSASLVGG